MKTQQNADAPKLSRGMKIKQTLRILVPLIPLSVALFYPMQDIFKESLLIGFSIFLSLIILKNTFEHDIRN